jgi:superfamily II DNA/RNA helicase
VSIAGIPNREAHGVQREFRAVGEKLPSLGCQIARAGYSVTSLRRNRTQGQRQSALNGFRGSTYRILVATDLAARGLDVESVSHVINYDMPDTADSYLHRIGRTGRSLGNGGTWR